MPGGDAAQRLWNFWGGRRNSLWNTQPKAQPESSHLMMERERQHDDGELMRRMQNGEEEAFVALYRRMQGQIYRFALHMCGNRAMAEDVVQETFMTLIQQPGRFDPERGPVSSYLLGIARNHLLRRFESDRRTTSLSDDGTRGGYAGLDDVLYAVAGFAAPVDLARGESIAQVREAVLSLPEHYREAVVLCDLQEMSYESAAAILQCAVGTLRSRLHRGARCWRKSFAAMRRKRCGRKRARQGGLAFNEVPGISRSGTRIGGAIGARGWRGIWDDGSGTGSPARRAGSRAALPGLRRIAGGSDAAGVFAEVAGLVGSGGGSFAACGKRAAAAYRRKHARQFRGLALPKRWRPAVLAAAAALAVAAAGTYTVRQLRFAGDQPAALAQHPSGGQTAAVTSESSAPAAEMSASPNVPADSNRASAKEQRALVAAARKPATRARTNESATSLEDIDATAGKFVALPYADAGPSRMQWWCGRCCRDPRWGRSDYR